MSTAIFFERLEPNMERVEVEGGEVSTRDIRVTSALLLNAHVRG